MPVSPNQLNEALNKAATINEEPLDALLARLMVAPSPASAPRGARIGSDSGPEDGVSASDKRSIEHEILDLEEYDPWKALSDEMNEEISRQIFDELDKQLEQQMMAELEKCQDEHSRRLDDELDRQLQQQLDAMMDAQLAGGIPVDEHGAYESYIDFGYSSGDDEDDEDDELEKMPWSEGGEGGIESLGIRQVAIENSASSSSDTIPGSILGFPRYTQEELQKMVDKIYGEEGGDKMAGPGAWGKGKWRPSGDTRGK